MSDGDHSTRTGAEFEIGGVGILLLVAGVTVFGLVSFWLGRLSVSIVPTSRPAAAQAQAPATVQDEGDLEQDLTFFDRLERAPEISAPESAEEPPVAASEVPAPQPPVPSGDDTDVGFQVQVLASEDRGVAQAMVDRLRNRGYPAHLSTGERDGSSIYRVRVGGYPEEEDARRVAQSIERQEKLRTWVTR